MDRFCSLASAFCQSLSLALTNTLAYYGIRKLRFNGTGCWFNIANIDADTSILQKLAFLLKNLDQSRKTFFAVNLLTYSSKARSFHRNAKIMPMFIKWSSLQESESKFMAKKFYKMDPLPHTLP
jgi:hypothetical protein